MPQFAKPCALFVTCLYFVLDLAEFRKILNKAAYHSPGAVIQEPASWLRPRNVVWSEFSA